MGSITQSTRVEKSTGRKVTVYRAYIRRAGVSKSKVFDKKTDAKRWLRDNEHADALAAAAASSKSGTLAALIEDFVTAPPDKGTKYWSPQHLDFWSEELGHLTVTEISRGGINAAKAKLQNKPVLRNTPQGPKPLDTKITPATVNRYLASLASVFNYAVKHEILDEHPMKGGKVEKLTESGGRKRILTDEEEGRLMAAARDSSWPMLPLFIRTCLTTAARRSEILNLRWQDVRLEESVAVLGKTKNGRPRALPLVSDVREAFEAAQKVKPLHSDWPCP